jgi:hypothetical protein
MGCLVLLSGDRFSRKIYVAEKVIDAQQVWWSFPKKGLMLGRSYPAWLWREDWLNLDQENAPAAGATGAKG